MKRVLAFATAFLIAGTMALAQTPAAQAAKFHGHVLVGKTSQNLPIGFEMVTKGNGVFLGQFAIDAQLTCEDSSTEEWGLGFGFVPHGPVLNDGTLNFDSVDPDLALHLHGHFGTKKGAGTIEITVAQLTQSEDAQACTTGQLRFHVVRHKQRAHGAIIAPSSSGNSARFVIRPGAVSERIS